MSLLQSAGHQFGACNWYRLLGLFANVECHFVSRKQNSYMMRKRNGSFETSKKYFSSVSLELNLTESNFVSFCIYALIETQGCFLCRKSLYPSEDAIIQLQELRGILQLLSLRK